jgi:catechol 2,3-dioxygenase-like lactoylglutathione lyase family enzyme
MNVRAGEEERKRVRLARIASVFHHVTIRASDRAASSAFYETVLAPLELEDAYEGRLDRWGELRLVLADASRPVTRGLHIAFGARSREEVDAFWQAGIAAGYTSDGEPGPRPIYAPGYYGGFLLDPDGNSVEAVHLGVPRTGDAVIDHLWIRVASLERSRAFYAAIAPALGLELRERPERFHVARGDRSFALVQGETPSANVQLAFPGFPDAIVLDPDGNTIEVVSRRG